MDTQLLDTVLKRYVARRVNLRSNSASQIAHSLSALNKHAGKAVTLRDCEGESGTDFLCDWLSVRLSKWSKATAKRDRGNVITLLRFAKAQHWIAEVPEVPTIRQERRMPTAWTLEELGALLKTAGSLTGMMRHLPIRRAWWFSTLLLFLYESGLRVTSALSLQTRDLWIDRRCARLRADTDKTWSDQVVTLSETLCGMIGEGLDKRMQLWPYPFCLRNLWRDLARIRERAGLPQGRDYGFHRLRKTHATQCVIVAGWEAARKSLGHSAESMTRVYVDMSQVKASGHVPLPMPNLT